MSGLDTQTHTHTHTHTHTQYDYRNPRCACAPRVNYYRHQTSDSDTKEKLPIKWLAPECIETNVFDESTDVVRIKIILKYIP